MSVRSKRRWRLIKSAVPVLAAVGLLVAAVMFVQSRDTPTPETWGVAAPSATPTAVAPIAAEIQRPAVPDSGFGFAPPAGLNSPPELPGWDPSQPPPSLPAPEDVEQPDVTPPSAVPADPSGVQPPPPVADLPDADIPEEWAGQLSVDTFSTAFLWRYATFELPFEAGFEDPLPVGEGWRLVDGVNAVAEGSELVDFRVAVSVIDGHLPAAAARFDGFDLVDVTVPWSAALLVERPDGTLAVVEVRGVVVAVPVTDAAGTTLEVSHTSVDDPSWGSVTVTDVDAAPSPLSAPRT